MHIYVFGSICRGEVTLGSDIDLLACVNDDRHDFDSNKYSIYTYESLKNLWIEGNPFAWHLHKESKLIYASDGLSFLDTLGSPSPYCNGREDCEKFYSLFSSSRQSMERGDNSKIFNLSSVFLSIRNISTCYALHNGLTIFSRKSAFLIDPKLEIPSNVYSTLERARILATRGFGAVPTQVEINEVVDEFDKIDLWMGVILSKVNKDD